MRIVKTNFDKIQDMMVENIVSNKITVESFWEEHVIESNHYALMKEDKMVGYFTIHDESTITSFYIIEEYSHLGQEIFEIIKRYEKVTNAMVTTGDEYFLAHCVDSFQRMEKQAYFSLFGENVPTDFIRKNIQFERVRSTDEASIIKLAGDFFSEDEVNRVINNVDYYRVYKVLQDEELIGFGIVETGRVIKSIASVGMFVMEDKRQQGYAKNILRQLKELVEKEGYEARSGCWYYNHNSLKSMKSAGAYPKSRLLRFYF
ncbi:GNAT family N-acetyltransferase [Gudongella sp. DL1XJH-153]|uniref:GNAT family N-acetyltransferase n=1 Tax=Gudongella sp. DL1XJH-153 TaxID=3409804 RepID=UPI003BB7D143